MVIAWSFWIGFSFVILLSLPHIGVITNPWQAVASGVGLAVFDIVMLIWLACFDKVENQSSGRM